MEKQQFVQNNKRWFVAAGMILLLLCLLTLVSMTTMATSAIISDEIEFIAEYGEGSQAIFVEGDLAYVGRGAYFVIVDITDRTNPVEIGRSVNFPTLVVDIDVVDQVAYVATGGHGLVIIDVTEPTSPVVISTFPDGEGIGASINAGIDHVKVEGSVAYLGMDGIMAVDVADPANPTMLGYLGFEFITGAETHDMIVSDDTAYILNGGDFYMIDLSDPTNLRVQGQFSVDTADQFLADIKVVGDVVYAVYQVPYAGYEVPRASGLYIFDTSNPEQITLLGQFDNDISSSSDYELHVAVGVAVAEDRAYLIMDDTRNSSRSNDIIQIDINDPSQPIASRSTTLSMSSFYDMSASDNTVGVIGLEEGLRLIDISQPVFPAEVGTFGESDAYDGVLHSIEGDTAYFVTNDGFRVVDITDPTALSLIANIGTIDVYYDQGEVRVVDGIAYVGYSGQGRLSIIDITNPALPVALGTVALGANIAFRDMIVDNGFAYIRDRDKGLYVVDVTDLSNPVEVDSFEMGELVSWLNGEDVVDDDGYPLEELPADMDIDLNGIQIVADTAYLATDNGLHLVDVSDKSALRIVGSYKTDRLFHDVDVVDNLAYVVHFPFVGNTFGHMGGIEIVDVSNPQTLIEIGAAEIGSDDDAAVLEEVHVMDDVAYMVDYHHQIIAVDVSDPENPSLMQKLNFPTFINRIHVVDGYMYLSGYGMLYTYRVNRDADLPPPPPIDPIISTPVITEPIALDVRSGLEDVLLRWQVVEPLEGVLDHYNVYRYQLGTIITPILLSSQVGSHYVDNGDFTAGERYCYYVEAIDDSGEIITASNITCTEFGELQLSVPHVVLPPDGRDIPVPVTVLNGNNLCLISMDITLVYDARLVTAVDVQPTAYTAGYQFESSIEQPGRVSIASITDECQPLAGSGALFDVLFDVRDDVGAISALNFVEGLTATAIYNDGEDTPTVLQMVNGSLTVGTDATRGDVSGDEVINAFDARTALEIAAGSIEPSPQQTISCDVNGDGSCNAADSSLILCYAAHETWGICDPTATTRSGGRQAITTLIKGELTAGKIPITLQNGANVSGGTVTFNYDPDLIRVNGIDTENTLLANWTVTADEDSGLLRVAFADDEPIGTDGTLFTINAEPIVAGATIQWAGAQFNDELGLDWESNLGHSIVYDENVDSVPLAVSVQEQVAWSSTSFVTVLLLLLCGFTAAICVVYPVK